MLPSFCETPIPARLKANLASTGVWQFWLDDGEPRSYSASRAPSSALGGQLCETVPFEDIVSDLKPRLWSIPDWP